MASGTMISNVMALAIGQAIADALDAGSTGAVVEIRTGAPPANVEAASTGTLLATLVCGVTAFDSGADQNPGALFTANAITSDTSADANGVAGYFVAGPSDDGATITTKVLLGTAGEAADFTDMVLDDKNIVIGGTVAITAWTFTVAES